MTLRMVPCQDMERVQMLRQAAETGQFAPHLFAHYPFAQPFAPAFLRQPFQSPQQPWPPMPQPQPAMPYPAPPQQPAQPHQSPQGVARPASQARPVMSREGPTRRDPPGPAERLEELRQIACSICGRTGFKSAGGRAKHETHCRRNSLPVDIQSPMPDEADDEPEPHSQVGSPGGVRRRRLSGIKRRLGEETLDRVEGLMTRLAEFEQRNRGLRGDEGGF